LGGINIIHFGFVARHVCGRVDIVAGIWCGPEIVGTIRLYASIHLGRTAQLAGIDRAASTHNDSRKQKPPDGK